MREVYQDRAFVWFKRSADQVNVDSIVRLGDCYYYGAPSLPRP